jgi:zinc transport system ATP-binding protein
MMAKTRAPVAAAHEVCFGFGDVKVIDRLNLVVEEGDFMGLLGPNGGGKTTLVRLLLGLLRPQCGEIELFGTELSGFRDWSLVGYVPQNATSFERGFPLLVREAVSMGRLGRAAFGRRMSCEDREAVEDSMAKVGVSGLADRRLGHLSGGQQQRVFIARALASKPRLLILDEPTAGVDVESNDRFFALLKDLNREGITIILVSHDIGTVTRNANRVACIAGSLFYHCPAPELTDERVRQLFGNREVLHHHHAHGGENG